MEAVFTTLISGSKQAVFVVPSLGDLATVGVCINVAAYVRIL